MLERSRREMASEILRNKYWILRHGKSIPNERGIIVSSLEKGILKEFGLAEEGIAQAQSAGEQFLKVLEENNILPQDVRICFSPFSRTRETAQAVAKEINISFPGDQCEEMNELRERFFGPSFELQSHEKYAEIWALDEIDPLTPPDGGESVADVVSRLVSVLTTIESKFQGCVILLVCHGDPLQIFQTVAAAIKQDTISNNGELGDIIRKVLVPSILSQHRKFALLTGELRQVA
ncbi:phosphoglycerate mutase family protein isoform X1 [Wolffia australiana]